MKSRFIRGSHQRARVTRRSRWGRLISRFRDVRRACADSRARAMSLAPRGSRRFALPALGVVLLPWSRSPRNGARAGCGSRGAFDGVGIYGRPRAPGIPDSHKLVLPAARKYRWGPPVVSFKIHRGVLTRASRIRHGHETRCTSSSPEGSVQCGPIARRCRVSRSHRDQVHESSPGWVQSDAHIAATCRTGGTRKVRLLLYNVIPWRLVKIARTPLFRIACELSKISVVCSALFASLSLVARR